MYTYIYIYIYDVNMDGYMAIGWILDGYASQISSGFTKKKQIGRWFKTSSHGPVLRMGQVASLHSLAISVRFAASGGAGKPVMWRIYVDICRSL